MMAKNAGDGNGEIFKLAQLDNLPEGVMMAFESGRSTLTIPGATVEGNEIKIPPGAPGKVAKIERMDPDGGTRKLVQVGNKKVLVVRIKTTGGLSSETTATAAQLGNSVFGTLGDTVTLASQYAACSYNTLTFSPLTTSSVTLSAPGVYDIEVFVTGNDRGTIVNAVSSALPSSLGYDHVMMCLPPGTSGNWIAYAYINAALSVYNDEWCRYLSGQVSFLLNVEYCVDIDV